MGHANRHQALQAAGLLHAHPESVHAPLFLAGGFFLAEDKVQVKYEMLRAHLVDRLTVAAASASHGYSRAGFYLVAAAFHRAGMGGLLDERRGRHGPVKLTEEIAAFITAAPAGSSGAALAQQVQAEFGVHLHRRTVERARR